MMSRRVSWIQLPSWARRCAWSMTKSPPPRRDVGVDRKEARALALDLVRQVGRLCMPDDPGRVDQVPLEQLLLAAQRCVDEGQSFS